MTLLSIYLAPLQSDCLVMSRCMQFTFGDKGELRCTFRLFPPLAYSLFLSQVGHFRPTGKPLPCPQVVYIAKVGMCANASSFSGDFRMSKIFR